MPLLVIKHSDRAPDTYPLGRIRITIGRSARNDLCIHDPFASRIHAEIYLENSQHLLQDLDSANGTFYNDVRIKEPVALAPGGRIRIGETQIEIREAAALTQGRAAANQTEAVSGAVRLADSPLPASHTTVTADTIINRSTSGLLQAIEGARVGSPGKSQFSTIIAPSPAATTIKSIDQQSDLLALISKVGVTLLSSATLDETLQQVAALVFEAVPAERCLIMLRDKAEPNSANATNQIGEPDQRGVDGQASSESLPALRGLQVRTAVTRNGEAKDAEEISISRSVIDEVVERGRSVLTADVAEDPRFRTVSLQGVRSVIAVPLGVEDEIFGLIYADSPVSATGASFTQEHLQVLTTLASVAAIRVENARLLEEQFERERMERELLVAREIQQRFQPASAPHIDGYDLLGISFSCYEIGGDYYDFIRCPEDRLIVALGDVSGKGTAAALLMSSLHAAIHGQVAACTKLADTINAVNRYLAANIPPNRFVTLFYAELNQPSGELAFINAGHNPPLIVRRNAAHERLESGGLPLGIMPNATFERGRTHLDHGDVLVIYSDGVSETQNPHGEEFGIERLREVVAANLDRTAAGIRDRIEAAITQFAHGTATADDITLVIVKRQLA